MKNFDIENIERKNIYKTPEDLFEKIQDKVLQEIPQQKEGKIIKLNWVYATAAAIAMIFGVTFIVNQNQDQTTNYVSSANAGNIRVNNTQSISKVETEATAAYQTLQQDLTSVAEEHQKVNRTPVSFASKVVVENKVPERAPEVQNSEYQVEQILTDFTNADLADLGKNAEQDVYLDLYN